MIEQTESLQKQGVNIQHYESMDYISNESQDFTNLEMKDPFSSKVLKSQKEELDYNPVIVTRNNLKEMNSNEIIIVDWPLPLRRRYYKNLLPEVTVKKCNSCNKVIYNYLVNFSSIKFYTF